MKRRNALPAIPPFIDQWDRPTYANPCGHNRRNPALTASGYSTAPIVEPLLVAQPDATAEPQVVARPGVVAGPAREMPSAAPRPGRVSRRERRAHQPSALTRAARELDQLADQVRAHGSGRVPGRDALAHFFGERPRTPRRKVLGTVVGLVAVVVGASAAFAFFTSHGSGSGTATAGTLKPVTVAATVGGDTPSSILLPGGSAADVILRVNNANARAVRLVSVTGGPGGITASGGTGTCTTTGVTFTNQPSLNVPIAASGTTLVHLTGAASMDTTSQTGCQGATFNIPVSITVHQP